MAEVFISYKREDELRVGRLVTALEGAGVRLWWDRGLPGSESWRENIQRELDGAKAVVVCWTEASVGAAGDFVRDEAGRAKERGILIPVLLERVRPPLGFGEVQAIDLSHWRGSRGDPFFRDLVDLIEAKLAGAPTPRPKGPMRRLVRRLTVGSLASAVLAGAFAFSVNAVRMQDQVCSLPLGQPGLADACGAIGLGNKPTREARLAWEALPANDCSALRAFRDRYETSPLRVLADSRLGKRHTVTTEEWVRSTRQDPPLSAMGPPAANETLARDAALARAQPDAERLCRLFSASVMFRYHGAAARADTWNCRNSSQGAVCEFAGVAHCDLEERQSRQTEVCSN